MYPRRGYNDRLHETVPIESEEMAGVIWVVIRWLINLLVNGCES